MAMVLVIHGSGAQPRRRTRPAPGLRRRGGHARGQFAQSVRRARCQILRSAQWHGTAGHSVEPWHFLTAWALSVRRSFGSTLCPVLLCPYLCSSEIRHVSCTISSLLSLIPVFAVRFAEPIASLLSLRLFRAAQDVPKGACNMFALRPIHVVGVRTVKSQVEKFGGFPSAAEN